VVISILGVERVLGRRGAREKDWSRCCSLSAMRTRKIRSEKPHKRRKEGRRGSTGLEADQTNEGERREKRTQRLPVLREGGKGKRPAGKKGPFGKKRPV